MILSHTCQYMPHRIAAALLLLLAVLFAPAALAATFTVDVLFDDSDAHDSNPGDGICDDTYTGSACTLRAAIEESNALAGDDTILFAVAGTIYIDTDQSEGPLPAIIDTLAIDGATAPGYAGLSPDLEDAPPVVYIDGIQVGGSSGSASGLWFRFATAQSSRVRALGVVNFANGIEASDDADDVWISSCYIGVLADGTAAGNGTGVYLGTYGNFIGTTLSGYGNVISGNIESGISIGASTVNYIRNNRIGTTPDGVGARGNGIGIVLLGADANIIGSADDTGDFGNVIAGNLGAGILGSDANNNSIVANSIGRTIYGDPLGNGGIGVDLAGDDNFIGSSGTSFGLSVISYNTDGIVLDGSNNTIDGNFLGSLITGDGNSGDGIRIEGGTGNTITDNFVLNSGGDGIDLAGGTSTVQGNNIGFTFLVGSGIQNHGNGGHGIYVHAPFNTIGGTAPGEGNTIGFSGGHGIVVAATNTYVYENHVGVTEDGDDIGNAYDGISVYANAASGADLYINTVAYNGGNGITVHGPGSGCFLRANSIFSNDGLGIDLGSDGITLNDFGDGDTGPNNLQNYPVITSVTFDGVSSPPQIAVDWYMGSTTTSSVYPIRVEFYLADSAASGEGKIYLGSGSVGGPSGIQITTLDLPAGTTGGNLVATAIDNGGGGSTSEFSPPVGFGDFDIIFQDGFDFTPL